MNAMSKAFLVAAGALALSAGTASAAVVCNSDGDCWRVRGKPSYGPSLGLRIHGDDWKWRRGDKYSWRDHGRGHGYYRDGAWITIR